MPNDAPETAVIPGAGGQTPAPDRDIRRPAQLLISMYGVRAARNADIRAKNLAESSPAAALHWSLVAAEIRRLRPDPGETPPQP